MYKLLFIIFLITFSIGLKSWGQEKLFISNGTWHGYFVVSGSGQCHGIIKKIKIINNIVTV